MTERADNLIIAQMAVALAEERRAVQDLRELGYEDPEGTLFALRLLEMRDEKGQTDE